MIAWKIIISEIYGQATRQKGCDADVNTQMIVQERGQREDIDFSKYDDEGDRCSCYIFEGETSRN